MFVFPEARLNSELSIQGIFIVKVLSVVVVTIVDGLSTTISFISVKG